jgi:hypothetical protein
VQQRRAPSGPDLEDGTRPSAGKQEPALRQSAGRERPAAPVHQHDVDREPHAEGVDRPAPVEPDRVPGIEAGSAQEPSPSLTPRGRDEHGPATEPFDPHANEPNLKVRHGLLGQNGFVTIRTMMNVTTATSYQRAAATAGSWNAAVSSGVT